MRDILICTVGTSLISNIKNQDNDKDIKTFCEKKNVKGTAVALSRYGADNRLCGAEINSIHSVLKARYLSERNTLIFLVSDTDEGRFSGQVLKLLFENQRYPDHFKEVHYSVLEGLTDEDISRFRNEGLRNLVRMLGQAVNRYGSNRLLINATGGYKAQISFAGMIGQALETPVCYMHERFSEVILLPPQPVSLDLAFWLDHADLFFELEHGIEKPLNEINTDERFLSLVDETSVDGTFLSALSPTGQLYHETFRYRFGQQRSTLLPPPSEIDPSMKKVRYEDKNTGKHKGLDVYFRKLAEVPYVKEIYTHYYNPDLNEPKRFRRSSKGLVGQIEGIFSNAGATTKFDLITTATTRELAACIADLNNLLAQGQL